MRADYLGFIFQRSHLIGGLTVAENVELGLQYSRSHPDNHAAVRARVMQALSDVDLVHRAQADVTTLSGGEMQRAAIARTLVRDTPLWLADEPTGNLDSAQSQEIMTLLLERAQQNSASLVVVTHEPEIAAQCSRQVMLADGRVVSDERKISPVMDAATWASPACSNVPPVGVIRTWWTAWVRLTRFISQGLRAQRQRTWAGVLACTFAVALTVTAMGLSQSASSQVSTIFDARRASQVSATLTRDSGEPRWGLNASAVREYAGVRAVEFWSQWQAVSIRNGEASETTAELNAMEMTPGPGSDAHITWLNPDRRVLGEGDVVLGQSLAARLALPSLSTSPEVIVHGTRLRVAGILTEARPGTAVGAAFVTPESVENLPSPRTVMIYAKTNPGAARQLADHLDSLANPFGEYRIMVDPVLQADAFRGQLQESVSVSLTVLAVVAALAGLVIVVMVTVLGVTRRIPEFGLRRALGSSRFGVAGLVMGECIVQGTIGSSLGTVVGFIAIMTVTAFARWQPVFDTRLLAIPMIASAVFGLGAAVVPAILAGRIQPADAVRG
jgi:macrolide transport system ATP-binding/permease protein